MKENNNDVSRLEAMAKDSLDYLSKYFDVNVGCNLRIIKRDHLPNDMLGRFHADEGLPFYRIEIDEGKLMRKLKKGNLEYKFQFVLDTVIGEEIGHLLFYLSHKEMHDRVLPENFRGLMFVQEIIGHYSGMVFANRDASEPLALRLNGENERAYGFAHELYVKYKDAKLAELSKVKSLSEFNYLIKSYEV